MSNFSSTEAKASYGIGMQMGQQAHGAFEGVELAALVAGIQDAFQGQAPQVEPAQINEAFQEIQQRLQAKQAEDAKKFAAEGEAFLTENAKRDEVTVLESGLQYEVIEQGSGEVPTAASTVKTHYAGTLIDGKEFDSSYRRGQPAEFPVGGVIKGWTEALQLMPVGSKWKLYIPYDLAYGAQGAGGDIGPYQALIFDIELLDIVA
ncbi:MAG: FKBP-type peptidyl-prolyl cis-trans isomerase [Gammaproteobacteria bacterium]|nr:FKBP-type peptidyl-prolyl cis-trans isomerase [Gammaproteobacteria bacterium]